MVYQCKYVTNIIHVIYNFIHSTNHLSKLCTCIITNNTIGARKVRKNQLVGDYSTWQQQNKDNTTSVNDINTLQNNINVNVNTTPISLPQKNTLVNPITSSIVQPILQAINDNSLLQQQQQLNQQQQYNMTILPANQPHVSTSVPTTILQSTLLPNTLSVVNIKHENINDASMSNVHTLQANTLQQ